jgi:hypothetical protein
LQQEVDHDKERAVTRLLESEVHSGRAKSRGNVFLVHRAYLLFSQCELEVFMTDRLNYETYTVTLMIYVFYICTVETAQVMYSVKWAVRGLLLIGCEGSGCGIF